MHRLLQATNDTITENSQRKSMHSESFEGLKIIFKPFKLPK